MFTAKVTVKINKDISQEIMKQLDQGLDDLADKVFEISQELCPYDQSTLKHSGKPEKDDFLNKRVVYDAPYAAAIEFGSVPHHVPRSVVDGELTKWAERKLGLSEKEANKAAWGIAGKIAALGGEAQPFLRPALDQVKAHAAEIIEKRMK